MNLDLVGDDVAVSVAHGIDLGDRETPVAEHGQRLFQRVVKIVLESRSLLGRSENRVRRCDRSAANLFRCRL